MENPHTAKLITFALAAAGFTVLAALARPSLEKTMLLGSSPKTSLPAPGAALGVTLPPLDPRLGYYFRVQVTP